jgi:uncharacterized RDD family membrane protein YckC
MSRIMDKHLRPSLLKRVVAILIDFLILGIVGFLSGLFLEEFYVSMGVYGTLFGSLIVVTYFGILHSHINNGQSIGKRIIDAHVVNLDGTYLSLPKSFLRACIIYLPIMNVAIFPSSKAVVPMVVLLILVLISTIYFTLINKSRRGLQDILVGTVVVNLNAHEFELNELNDRSKKKLIPIVIVGLLMMGIGFYLMFSSNYLHELLNVRDLIEQRDEVISVYKIESKTTTTSKLGSDEPTETYSSYIISVWVNNQDLVKTDTSGLFEEYYEILKQEVPLAKNADFIIVTASYGYNIGISSRSTSMSKTFE